MDAVFTALSDTYLRLPQTKEKWERIATDFNEFNEL